MSGHDRPIATPEEIARIDALTQFLEHYGFVNGIVRQFTPPRRLRLWHLWVCRQTGLRLTIGGAKFKLDSLKPMTIRHLMVIGDDISMAEGAEIKSWVFTGQRVNRYPPNHPHREVRCYLQSENRGGFDLGLIQWVTPGAMSNIALNLDYEL
jgi:hypothetical protein